MKLLATLIFFLTLAAASYADGTVPNVSNDFKIVQFPDESWDGKWLQFLVRVDFPKMEGKTQEEAEAIRKVYVTQGLKNAIALLFNIATYDPTAFNVHYNGTCDHLAEFPPKGWNMSELVPSEAKQQCDEARGRAGDKANNMSVNGGSWASPERDVSAKSYDEILKFGEVITRDHLPFAEEGKKDYRYSLDNRFFGMNFGNTKDGIISVLNFLKDDQGHQVPLLEVAVANGVALHPNERDSYVNISPTGSFRNSIKVPQGYDVSYHIPSISVGAIPGANGTPTQMQIVVPNRKLINLFQGSGPTVTAAGMTQMQKGIEEKLKPFDLHLSATYQQGGLAGLVQADDESDGKAKKGTSNIPRCVKSVDLRTCNEIWAYAMLAYAQFEPQRDKTNPNIVTIKVNVPIDTLSKSTEPYAKYMAK